jgi:hypothetical protein
VEEPWSFWFKKLSQTIDNIFVMIWCKKLGKNSNIIGPSAFAYRRRAFRFSKRVWRHSIFSSNPSFIPFFILRFIIEDNAAQKV